MTCLVGRRCTNAVRRLVALAALFGFLGGTVGVPLPHFRLAKDRSKPFPCQDHACGCASAEQCWRSCCCFTNQQKLAWAADHDVQPPEYVYVAAARELSAAPVSACCQQTRKVCCGHDEACCEEHHEQDVAAFVANHDPHGVAAAPATSWSIDWVSAIDARKCQGQAELWLTLGAVTRPPAKTEIDLQPFSCGFVCCRLHSLIGIGDAPAAPPPRA
jgi:hypothetical protein